MESILKSIKKKNIPINPAIVISNKPNAKVLKIAKKLGINIEIIESKNFKRNRAEYDKKVMAVLTKYIKVHRYQINDFLHIVRVRE